MKNIFNYLVLLYFLVALGVILPTLARAEAVCDPNYYNKLVDKAKGEIQRESDVNDALIKKPDSVLGLSCFDQDTKAIADAGITFSDQGGGTKTLTAAMDKIVGDDSNSYLYQSLADSDSNVVAAADISSTSKTANQPCDRLKKAWREMRNSSVADDKSRNILLQPVKTFYNVTQSKVSVTGVPCPPDDTSCSAKIEGTANAYAKAEAATEAAPTSPAELGTTGLAAGEINPKTGKKLVCSDEPATPIGAGETKSDGKTLWAYKCPDGCTAPDDVEFTAGTNAPPRNCK